jgi:uncharacterized repeat protein (TIGR01451 family)
MKNQYLFKLLLIPIYLLFSLSVRSQCIDPNDRPLNDDPSPMSTHPPHVLTLGGSHMGTTCCAIGYNDNNDEDIPNLRCSEYSNDDAVWYQYTTGSEKGISIILEQDGLSPIGEFIALEVYRGENEPTPELFGYQTFACGSLPFGLNVGCYEPNEKVWIKVASNSNACGTFKITLTQTNTCPINDLCSDATTAFQTNPTDANCGDFTPITIEGCLELACPDNIVGFCGSDTLPTVWFKVQVDAGAVQLGTSVGTSGGWDPVWAIYHGSCNGLTPLNASSRDQPAYCSNSDANPDVHTVGIITGQNTYWIAVSGYGMIDDPTFIMNVWTSALCVSCIGDEGCTPEAEFTVQKRSSNKALDDPLFFPDEEVTVCFDYLYDASETGVDWLHGLIPDFGAAWDLQSFNPAAISVTPPGAEWRESDGSLCAPIITEQMPYLCTYTDPITGKLKLCHTGCQSCPCTGPLFQGSPLPSGWFWSTNGGAGCENSCSPSTHYGLGQGVANIHFCMDLKVKTQEQLSPNGNLLTTDLHINFQTTSDGVSGCWEDPIAECKLDFAQIGPRWELDTRCNFVTAADTTVVSSEITYIPVTNYYGLSDVKIYVTPAINPNVTGMRKDTMIGNGVIRDTLINLTNEIQEVKYFLVIDDSDPSCQEIYTVKVLVYPEGSYKKVQVSIYNDRQGNGVRDLPFDTPIPSFKVFVPSQNYTYYTNNQGVVTLLALNGNLQLDIAATWGKWQNPDTTINVIVNDTCEMLEVGFIPLDQSIKYTTALNVPFLRCETQNYTQQLLINQSSNAILNGKVVLIYDQKLNNNLVAVPDVPIDQSNQRVEWQFSNLQPGQTLSTSLMFIAPPINTTMDSLSFTMYTILNFTDTVEIKKVKTPLRCSYDPNDKAVYPDRPGDENFVLRDEELQYTIRFQNVGNDTAYTVRIEDVLDPSLDLNTIHLLYASHEVKLSSTGQKLIFDFENIDLVDSMTNPEASQGFVIFSIASRDSLMENTKINNTASIYFDQNDPVITNTVHNTLVTSLPCPLNAIWIVEDTLYVNATQGASYKWYNCTNNNFVATTSVPYFTPSSSGEYYCLISGYFCDVESKCALVDLTSSTIDEIPQFKIYPNPGSQQITIIKDKALGNIKLENVVDVHGKSFTISVISSDKEWKADTTLLPSGMYVITIRDQSGKRYNLKWIKM